MGLSQIRNLHRYQAIKEEHEEKHYSIAALCEIAHVSRAGFYKWLKRTPSKNEIKNNELTTKIRDIYEKDSSKGYRRIRDDLIRDYHEVVNEKRILRICRIHGFFSTIKYTNNGCTKSAKKPYHIGENYLNRNFYTDCPNEKWLTDVTEFQYHLGSKKHKLYLSAILDLYDRRIVAYVIGDSNNNELVFQTLDKAIEGEPDAHPLFHSDRGFQYTSRMFYEKLQKAGMKQSMSRVGKCIDNGPMEGFWGILKRERYYGKYFTSRQAVVDMIEDYIDYYNNKRYQRKLGVVTPIEKYTSYSKAA